MRNIDDDGNRGHSAAGLAGFIFLIFILAMLTINLRFITPAHAAVLYNYNVDVYVNGSQVAFPDQKAYIDDNVGRTYVPVRFVSEALGCNVSWDDKTKTAKIAKGGTWVDIKIGSNNPKITDVDSGNVTTMTIDAPAMLLNDRTMVPLRFVSEELKATVTWKSAADTGTGRGRVDVNQVQGPVSDINGVPPGSGKVINAPNGGGGVDTSIPDKTPWPEVQ